MSKLKFRAWKSGRFNYSDDGSSWSSFWCCNDPTYDDEIIFQQFTGLFDVKGKEIYEGDIVKFYTNGDRKDPTEHIKEVIYCEHEARWCPIIEDCTVLGGGSCEVIGNIFENSEPLK